MKVLAEALKTNTTLTRLEFNCTLRIIKMPFFIAAITPLYLLLVNNISDEEAEALTEALKMNTTLIELNINIDAGGPFGGNINAANIVESLNKFYDLVARNRINYEFSKNPSPTQLNLNITYLLKLQF